MKCLIQRVLFLCLPMLLLPAYADDIEIYTNAGVAGSEPMVMFFLDYRPNLGSTVCSNVNACPQADYFRTDPNTAGDIPTTGKFTLFDQLRLALKQVFARTNDVKVGLMLHHRNTCNGNPASGPDAKSCSNGAYIPFGFRLLDDTTRDQFNDLLWALPTPTNNNNAHKNQGQERTFEFFRYLTGQGVYNGHNGYDDFDLSGPPNLDKDFPAVSWDESIEMADPAAPGQYRYITPLNDNAACGKIFSVNITFGTLNQADDSNAAIAAPKEMGGMALSNPDHARAIQMLFDTDFADGSFPGIPDIPGVQNVTSYFLSPKSSTFLEELAIVGGSESVFELGEDPQEMVDTLENLFAQILSVSSTFVPVTLPVNAFNRSEVVDNVFLALFEAQAEGRPAWEGNLKKLRLGNADAGQAELIDALGANAVAVDGRIRNEALTLWTNPLALPPPDPERNQVAGRDGRFPGRGGAGQKIPGFVTGGPGLANGPGKRMLYFDASSNSLGALNADAATATTLQGDLAVASSAEAQALIAYMRGMDVDDLDEDSVTAEARPWLFGDPLHSRPVAINYGMRDGHSADNPLIYVAVGSNDGYMRLIRNTDAAGNELGQEVWGFMPRAVMSSQKVLRENKPTKNHPYGVDGMPVVYKQDVNGNGTIDPGDKVLLVFGLRRGGSQYYAIDISNPESPSLRWRIDSSGDFSELGLTFSNPRVVHVNPGSGPRPALIFGGGYDTNKDSRSGTGTDDSVGNALYVVDLATGTLIWKAVGGGFGATSTIFRHPDLVDSVPSDIAVVDTDGTGLADRAMFGDTGGNIWRADLVGPSEDWKLTRLAKLGRHAAGGKKNDRRFFHRPDFVASRDHDGPFDAIIIGSGDRADPKDKGGEVDNYIFMIKDRHVGAGTGTDSNILHVDLADVTDNCLQDDSCTTPPDLVDGWKILLERSGEKVLASPLTIAGTVYITSFVRPQFPPGAATSCKLPEGDGYLYALSLRNGTARRNYNENDNPLDDPDSPNSKDDRDTKLLSSGIPPEVVPLPPDKILRPDLVMEDTGTTARWKIYWHEVEDADL